MATKKKQLTTAPKPFVFVLMPFDQKFRDIYEFGIKGAAEDVGAYAERVDEQHFGTSILDRIYNQINKSDVIVADMTGRNANVFYEVGYAHALGKLVLLLTQDADDIPFDLKHHQHTVYGGEIAKLRKELAQRLKWALAESKGREQGIAFEEVAVSLAGELLPELPSSVVPPVFEIAFPAAVLNPQRMLTFTIRNSSARPLQPINYLYILTTRDSGLVPHTDEIHSSDGSYLRHHKGRALDSGDEIFPVQYRLDQQLALLPPGAVEEIPVAFGPRHVTFMSKLRGTKWNFIL